MTRRTFLLIDTMNMLWRCKHSISPKSPIDDQIGMGLHRTIATLQKSANLFSGAHLVFALEGTSWRRSVYPDYKLNRKVLKLKQSITEQENEALFMEAANDFCSFLTEKTNATVIQCEIAEADDMIAMWIKAHPDDDHVIVSSDSDFYQLLADNVKIYDGMKEIIVTLDGVFDEQWRPAIDKRTSQPLPAIDPEYHLFEKCIRGDKSDNIFSAFPGVRKKGTKNKIGILEAYADRKTRGYTWNNFMNQKWTDHNGDDQCVKERYEFNRFMIDLGQQPEDIQVKCLTQIAAAYDKPRIPNIGIHFMRFCGRWDLKRISDNAASYAKLLNEQL